MMYQYYLIIASVPYLLHHETNAQGINGVSIQKVIERAVQDYKAEKYEDSIKRFETGLVHWRMLKHIDTNCGLRCNSPNISKETGLDFTGFDELLHYGNLLAQANCIKICKEEHPFTKSNIKRPSDAFIADFEKRVPYNYLQFAYYKTGQIKKACQAAHTHYQVNPHDTQMRENIEFYKGLDEVADDYFTDMEGNQFTQLFQSGVQLYVEKSYKDAVEKLEKALLDYFRVHDECKALCYSEQTPAYFYRFPNAIVSRYIPPVECLLTCDEKLRPLIGDIFFDNLVAKIYSYLQFSYYQLEKWGMAVPAAASALLLDPTDQMSVSNFKYYTENAEAHGLNPKIHFHPRLEAVKYHLERKTNDELLDLMKKAVGYDEDEMDVEETGEEESLDSSDLLKEISRQVTLSITKNMRGDVG